MPVAVATDSTAYLPEPPTDRATAGAGARPTVVPLTVVLGGVQGLEGIEVSPADVSRAMTGRRIAVSTSRPAPEQFAAAYRRLFDLGASGIVSVHLSAELSGTVDAATLAAAEFGDRVTVIDSRSTGMGLGFPALVATSAAADGADLARVAQATRKPSGVRSASSTSTPSNSSAGAAGSTPPRRCSAPPCRSSRSCTSATAGSPSGTRCAPRAGDWPDWSTWPSPPPVTRRST